ncbi:zinc ribbon domain-containing protein [Nonomuraea sp. NPDC050022]|uniref:zinc ribbon domain-containing protein n=1 Tax=Nonomuraea sp. NPDC050022 TaxID=3364358 RepID=UPI003789619B
MLVDPAYTSQACPECGWVSRANRPARGRFVCTGCGLAGHADHIAARNIATRGIAGWAVIN